LQIEARKDFISGHMAAAVFKQTDWQHKPWKCARYLAVHEEMAKQWRPQGGIDGSMIDMLAITFTLWMYWTEQHILRSTTEPRSEPPSWVSEREYLKEAKLLDGHWDPPYIHEQQAIEQAAQTADRWRRAYHATLRQMRDWRRYNVPVTIHNPRQANIAADGGQQVNAAADLGQRVSQD